MNRIVSPQQQSPPSRPENRNPQLNFLHSLTPEQLLDYAEQRSTDKLTGLLNYDAFQDALQYLSTLVPGKDKSPLFPMRFILGDLVGLHGINHTERGPLAGDYAIRAFGKAIQSSLRDYDVVGRAGGDEIIAALLTAPGQEPVSIPSLERITNNIYARLTKLEPVVHAELEADDFTLRARIGYATLDDPSPQAINYAKAEALKNAFEIVKPTDRAS